MHPWDLCSNTETRRAAPGVQLPLAHPLLPSLVEVLGVKSESLEQGDFVMHSLSSWGSMAGRAVLMSGHLDEGDVDFPWESRSSPALETCPPNME